MAEADTNTLLAAIGAGAAILGSIVSSATIYYIEKKRFENETRRLLRDERKILYTNLSHELSNFQKNHLRKGLYNYGENDDADVAYAYGAYLHDACSALKTIKDNFATEIELTQNLEIGKILQETYHFLQGFENDWLRFISAPPDDDEEFGNSYYVPMSYPDLRQITYSDIDEIEDKLGEIIRLMRAELVPFQDEKNKDKEYRRIYWWEKAKAKRWWRF